MHKSILYACAFFFLNCPVPSTNVRYFPGTSDSLSETIHSRPYHLLAALTQRGHKVTLLTMEGGSRTADVVIIFHVSALERYIHGQHLNALTCCIYRLVLRVCQPLLDGETAWPANK